jgi:glycine/D-amino acid oxidase-like deaminating enzyme
MPASTPILTSYDAVVIGAGIFGCYAALHLARQGRRVLLLESEQRPFRKASLVNQARLHGGYHYPRSLVTAAMSDEHKSRFTAEHRDFVLFSFEKYYAIDRFGSFTDARQFERFCERLQIRCEPVNDHPLFNYDRLEALYLTEEYTFDPVLLGQFYTQKIENESLIHLSVQSHPIQAIALTTHWQIGIETPAGQQLVESPLVINATYAATNALNRLFDVPDLELTHEISEIAFVTSPQLGCMGLTVMDGPFGSIMPYGKSGLLSLSSVAYTHHKISYNNLPHFDCQADHTTYCRPERPGLCTDCTNRPESHAAKMMSQMQQYFSEQVQLQHWHSYFTIKSKLKASHIDDGRPTEIACLRKKPLFYCLFAGKINSIYEVEKIV